MILLRLGSFLWCVGARHIFATFFLAKSRYIGVTGNYHIANYTTYNQIAFNSLWWLRILRLCQRQHVPLQELAVHFFYNRITLNYL